MIESESWWKIIICPLLVQCSLILKILHTNQVTSFKTHFWRGKEVLVLLYHSQQNNNGEKEGGRGDGLTKGQVEGRMRLKDKDMDRQMEKWKGGWEGTKQIAHTLISRRLLWKHKACQHMWLSSMVKIRLKRNHWFGLKRKQISITC